MFPDCDAIAGCVQPLTVTSAAAESAERHGVDTRAQYCVETYGCTVIVRPLPTGVLVLPGAPAYHCAVTVPSPRAATDSVVDVPYVIVLLAGCCVM